MVKALLSMNSPRGRCSRSRPTFRSVSSLTRLAGTADGPPNFSAEGHGAAGQVAPERPKRGTRVVLRSGAGPLPARRAGGVEQDRVQAFPTRRRRRPRAAAPAAMWSRRRLLGGAGGRLRFQLLGQRPGSPVSACAGHNDGGQVVTVSRTTPHAPRAPGCRHRPQWIRRWRAA